MHALALLAAFTLAAPRPQPALLAEPDLTVELPLQRKLLATGLAIVPGLVVPGLGHRLEGDKQTANRLVLISGCGLASLVAGYAMLSRTEGNHDLAPLYLSMVFAGATTLLASWAGDVLGSARPEGQGRSFSSEESLAASLVYGSSFEPAGRGRQLGILRAAWESPKVLVDGWGSLSLGSRYQDLHLRAGAKLLSDGRRSHLALVAEGMRELGAKSDSAGHGGALMVEGRLDAGLLSKSLSGLVVMQRLGGGALVYSYPGTSATDLQAMLVFETGFALPLTDWLEVSALYSQRPDTRLGFFMDHGGAIEWGLRLEALSHVRILAQGHIGAGADVLAGVEAAW